MTIDPLGPLAPVAIRAWRDDDSIPALTRLLHRAYAPLAAAGMRYYASHQDDDATRSRIARGRCFVAEMGGAVVGAIVYRRHGKDCPYYEQPHVATFGQFAVEPGLQGRGIGGRLLERAEAEARADGAREMALDTAEHAEGLIALYRRRGYRVVAEADWDVTNYRSVIMAKVL